MFIDNEYDYGIIIKIKSDVINKRRHMCVAGIAEWGTSGAAYYLSKNWKKIAFRTLFKSEFAALIKVKRGSDDSAKLIEIIK